MSAEEFFRCESLAFLFASGALFMVLYGVSCAVWWCFCVVFYVVLRDV